MNNDVQIGPCYARWSGTRLTLGNAWVERAWLWRDGSLFAESWLDKRSGKQWITPGGRVPSLTPRGGKALSEAASFAAGEVTDGPTERPSLIATLTCGPNSFRFKIFPDSATVVLRLFAPSTIPSKERATSLPTTSPTGVEEDASTAAPSNIDDTLDCFIPAPPHLRLTQVTLVDRTDAHDNLVHESDWLLLAAEAPLLLAGNVFILEDTLTGDGLAFIKLAPLPHARPDHSSPDLRAVRDEIRLMGNGMTADIAEGYPLATIAYTGGRVGRITAIQQFQRQIRPYEAGRDAIFLSNTWGDRNKDIRVNQAFVEQELIAGAKIGVEVVQIDDGWQHGRTANSAVAGGVWDGFWATDETFWAVNATRFPSGLASLSAAAKKSGLKLGLWFAPDSSNDFANWKRDADRLLELHREFSIEYFKIDGVKVRSRAGEVNLRNLLERCVAESKQRITFDMDITAENRPAYFGMMFAGPLFVENRYTDWHRYWPHATLRNLWMLAHYIDPLRLRMEFLNTGRHTDQYRDDPLAPALYRPDYLFASVMFANPLGWFEISQLPATYAEQVAPLVKLWKQRRDDIFAGTIYPIGQEPTGSGWTGFASILPDGSGSAVLFRELNASDSFDFEWPTRVSVGKTLAVLAGRGSASWQGNSLRVSIQSKLDFLWISFA